MNWNRSASARVRLLILSLLCSLAAGVIPTQAAFELVEDFEGMTSGSLNGQRGWSATLAQVKADPAQAGNAIASFEGAGSSAAHLPLVIAEGTTATLFFRAYSEADTTLVDWFAGMSDVSVSGVGAFGDFEVQIGYSGSQILDTLRVRDASAGSAGVNEAAGEFLARTWYKIWAVIDNTTDTYEVFIQGGSYAEQTQVVATASGKTVFTFRNSRAAPVANDLIRFFVKSGTAALPGPALLDDIYLAPGIDLSDPVPGANEPPTIAITAPANGAAFSAPANIAITVEASDSDGTISQVEFFAGATLIGTATSSPFSFTWNSAPAGLYNLTAKATDNLGGIRTSAAISITVNPTGTDNFVLLDGFETAALGNLSGQNGWTAANASVLVDPTRSDNQVASFQGTGGASLPAFLPDSMTGTLFFRVYSVSDTPAVNWSAGLSDMAAAGPGRPLTDFEAQVSVMGAQRADTLLVRDGGAATDVPIGEFQPRTWYKIWMVVNNPSDLVEVHMQGGQLAEPTLLIWDDFGYTDFYFRNSGFSSVANDMVRFLVLTAAGHTGQFLMDDVYFDQFGKNLNDPVGAIPLPPTVALTAPPAGAAFTAPADITITAEASSAGSTISQVEFFAGPTLIGTDTTSPYGINWTSVPPGFYRLTAKATDSLGGSQISAPITITVNQPAGTGGFQLFEDFEQAVLGSLNGQGGWEATLVQVKADPENGANQVASFEGAGDGAAYRPLLIPEGDTATLFFRFYTQVDDPQLRDWWAGMSDTVLTGVPGHGEFEVQIGLTGGATPLRVRDGTAGAPGNVDVDEHLPRTWYKVWAVIDNAADTYEVYVQGGSLIEQTQVDRDSNGTTSFGFRNSTAAIVANDLTRFFVRSGTATRPGPVLLDDIYLASGKDLDDPTAGMGMPLEIVEINSDSTAGSITLRWEGGGPQFQVEKAATVTGTFQPVGAVQSERVFTDPGALTAGAQSFYRVRQVGGGEPALCSTATAGGGFVNTPFGNQTGTFTAQFDATPAIAPIDSVMALSSGPPIAFGGLACLVRFNPSGIIDARNGGAYTAASVIPYSANVKYTFRFVVNIPAHTYSIFVTPEGGAEQTVGADYAFRTEQNAVTSLDNWVVTVASAAGATTVCDFHLP